MARKLAKVLKTEVMGDLSALGQLLQSYGRGKDTILAHITPEEAEMLKDRGGRGSTNPQTGLLEFETLPEVTVSGSRYLPSIGVSGGYGTSGGTSRAPEEYTVSTGLPAEGGFGVTRPPVAAAPEAAAIPPPTLAQQAPPEEGFATKLSRQAKAAVKDLTAADILKGVAIGGLGLTGARAQRGAAAQARTAADQQRAIAEQYQKMGRQMAGGAVAGQLSPASLQAYQAYQARLAQEAEKSGGVGVTQAAGQLEAFRQTLLANQLDYGLKVAQIGDNYAVGAIRTALQADADTASNTQNFYALLASIVAGQRPRA